ncbi:MAG: DUF2357 domain-containing protein [Candidatus Syntrophonatronum acetioxidans]|uniref:DUF2357 domain-containing protein n=1 Tax=Candidatus Syntrophonatronum acetioxidans TaxID=1795816 RepID=A0A424YCQ0_9FIRM|nr:MAG: DUF2357 domain-containing protein [Candidatus Syntrophonatronum acetioxidans]
MVLPPSGLKVRDLLVVSTRDFHLTVKGVPHNKVVEAFCLHQKKEGESLKATLNISSGYQWAKVYDPAMPYGLKEYRGGEIYPCFFEQTNYEMVIEKKEECDKELYLNHSNRYLREAVTPAGSRGQILSGIINFKDEVGPSRFEIWGDNQRLLSFELEVFPSKLDYITDFWQLLKEVNEEVYNLAYDFLMKTSFSAALRKEEEPAPSEFYYILNAVFDKMFRALNRIRKQPHHKILPVNQIVPPEKVKKADAKTVNWLSKRAHLFQSSPAGIKVAGNTYLPRRVLDRKKELTYDTFENRYLKWLLKQVGKKLKDFAQRYEEAFKSSGDPLVKDKVDYMIKKLNRFCNISFLRDVGNLERLESSSLVMQMAPGYRDVFKYYLMLLKGLNIKSDLFELSIKNLAELYEYWCFLKLNKLLREKYHLERNGLISLDERGITVSLAKGRESTLVYRDKRNDEKFEVMYNRSFTNLPTITQRPDNVLSLEKSGSAVTYKYIFDAKYRINVEEDYIRNFGQPGPPEDTINTMHRYRDAVVAEERYRDNYKRNVFGAFIFFPHNDEMAYAGRKKGGASKFYESVDRISIGALPFLPSQTALVEEFLDELLLESSDTAFERALLQEGTKEYLVEEEEKNVLIGPLGRRGQLDVCLKNNMYYTYLERVHPYLGTMDYVAIYQSKEKFNNEEEQGIIYYGKIKDYRIMPRGEIREMPVMKWEDKLAVKFYIEEWLTRDPKIDPGGYGPSRPLRASWRLFQEARIYPELHLSQGEVRLWRELRRFKDCESVKFPKDKISESDRLELLSFPGLTVKRMDLNIFKVMVNGRYKEYDFRDLKRGPGKILKDIIRFWRSSGKMRQE